MTQEKLILNSSPERGCYPQTRVAGNLLFLSGIGPRNPESDKIPGVNTDVDGNVVCYEIETQCHSIFKNLQTIVENGGSSWDNIIDVTVFMTNMKKDYEVFNSLYSEYFQDSMPCRTVVEVSALPSPIAIELKCIALL